MHVHFCSTSHPYAFLSTTLHKNLDVANVYLYHLQDLLLFITCGAAKGSGQFLLAGPETAVTQLGSKWVWPSTSHNFVFCRSATVLKETREVSIRLFCFLVHVDGRVRTKSIPGRIYGPLNDSWIDKSIANATPFNPGLFNVFWLCFGYIFKLWYFPCSNEPNIIQQLLDATC